MRAAVVEVLRKGLGLASDLAGMSAHDGGEAGVSCVVASLPPPPKLRRPP